MSASELVANESAFKYPVGAAYLTQARAEVLHG